MIVRALITSITLFLIGWLNLAVAQYNIDRSGRPVVMAIAAVLLVVAVYLTTSLLHVSPKATSARKR